jgi:ankyrin repeat protein
MTEILRQLMNSCFFSKVDTKAGGRAAIHCACAQGNADVVKCLLEFSPDLEIKVTMCVSSYSCPCTTVIEMQLE